MEYDVFISYSRKDTNIANRICKAFDEAGISYFIDRQGIGGAYEFPAVLAEAIISSRIFLYLASENSYGSKYTQSEITFAFNRKDRGTILPYIIDGSSMPISLEFVFSAINWRNMREHPIETALVDDLLNLLGKERPKAKNSSVSVTENKTSLSPSRKSMFVKPILVVCISLLVIAVAVFFLRPNKELAYNHDVKENSLLDTLCIADTVDIVADVIDKAGLDNASSMSTVLKKVIDDKDLLIDVNGISFIMKYVDAGSFMMGADKGQQNAYADEKPAHKVVLKNDYYIGETEVSQDLWEIVMGKNPSMFKDSHLPVEQISYKDCLAFIARLNELTGKSFRLPTEAEWEFAARGGNVNSKMRYSGNDVLSKVAWYSGNSGGHTHDVKGKEPNVLGVYDMTGNVWEWCSDCYGVYPTSEIIDPKGPNSGKYRVYRGGCWGCDDAFSRLTIRGYDAPDYRSSEVGVRLALDVN